MMLEVSELAAGYGRIPILSDVSFTVARANSSVSSATTAWARRRFCARSWATFRRPRGGVLEGEDLTRAEPYRRARAGMGYVPQGREIFPGLSVRDNLRMGAVGAKDEAAAIESALESSLASSG